MRKIQNAVLDTETAVHSEKGVDFFKDEIVELTIIPLLDNFEIDVVSPRFTTLIQPLSMLESDDKKLPFNNISYGELRAKGIKQEELKPFLMGWMNAVGVEQFVPLAHNWAFDRVFLAKSLGCEIMDSVFNRRARDSHSLAVSINDRYALAGKEKPFESTSLGFLANFFGIDTSGAHRAEADCIMTAIVYKNLLQFEVPTF